MKQKLLLLGASLLMSAASFAQWVKPIPPTADELVLSNIGVDTTQYYLYNAEAEAFFTEGNAWGTQASFTSNLGLKVFFSKYLIDDIWDEKTIFINDFSNNKNSWQQLFIDNENQMFVDHGDQPNFYWEYAKSENGFRFFGAEINPSFNQVAYPNSYMGIDPSLGTTTLSPLIDIVEFPDAMVDWQLVPVDQAEEFVGKLTNYKAAVALGELIDQVEAEYPELTSAIAAAKEVYTNYSATTEELNDASKALKLAVNYASIAGATEESPKDATQFFQNPDFSAGNIDGWDCTFQKGTNVTNLGYQGANYTNGEVTINQFIEAWANSAFNPNFDKRALGDGQLSQTLPSLPAGKYKFACDAIAVTQDDVNTPCVGVYLFAESGNIKPQTSIHTGNEKPEHFEFTFVTTGDDVILGLKTNETTANWIAADNFTLTYYGELTDDPEKVLLLGYVSQLEEQYPDMDEVAANAEVKEAFSTAIEEAKASTENYAEYQSALEAAAAALATSVSDYKEFWEVITDSHDKQAQFDGTKFAIIGEELGDLLMDWEGFYAEGSVDGEFISGAKAAARKVVVDNVTELMEAGDDVSVLLDNPSFDKGFSGWQTKYFSIKWGGLDMPNINGTLKEYQMNSGNAEAWHAGNGFEMSQVVYNMPKGSFTITCQAFERKENAPDFQANWEIGKEEGISAVLFVNDKEQKLNNVLAYASEEQLFAGDDPTVYPSDRFIEAFGLYIPDSQAGANYYFNNPNNPGAYINKVNIVLQEAGDSITIGIKNPATVSWTLFDNFRLIYNGAGADAYYEQIDELIASLQSVFENAEIFGADAQKKADEAVASLQEARLSANPDVCVAAIADGEAALAYAKKSIEDYRNLNAKYNELVDAFNTYMETAEAEALETANGLIDSMADAISDASWTNEEVEKAIADASKAIALLKLPANYKEASEENPIDVSSLIINANFDEIGNFTGWSGDSFGAGGTTSTCAEHYNKKFNTYQDVVGLPAGYYIAKVKGFYRRGTTANDYNIQQANPDSCKHAMFYASSNGEEVSCQIQAIADGATAETLGGATAEYGAGMYVPNTMESAVYWFEGGFYGEHSLVVKVGEDGVLRIGVKKEGQIGDDWSIFDTFELFYIGACESESELTRDLFHEWSSYEAGAEIVGAGYSEGSWGVSAGTVYGNSSVLGNNYADLSSYNTLALTVSEGTPRLLFNRQSNDGSSSDFLEINSAANEYVTVTDNVWYIDLAKIVADKGYAHLNVIKGANWANVTIDKAVLTSSGPVEVESVPQAKKAFGKGIFSTSGLKFKALQKNQLNIVGGNIIFVR